MISAARPSGDFSKKEIGLAILFALAVQAGAVLSLRSAGGNPSSSMPATEIEPIAPTAVKVIPVFDTGAPLLKLGGKPDPTRLPDRFIPQAPKPRAEEKAFVSTKAGKSEEDIPPKDVKLAEPNETPPPPDAELTKQVDTPIASETPPAPPANVAEEGHQDGVPGGTETDPLKARAVDLYRARIVSWFSRRFRVSGSGLSADDFAKFKVNATVELSSDRMVQSYSITPSGNSAFDAAARAALESAKGAPLPPPPENYPDVVQRTIHLTFVCKEDRCD
ncbi:MAG: TonB C-terminal domain-containing protein [Polyangiaceae bacterium]|nr:TonB C-terminal domain-containing protein [Polyangiaceae bacterium]